MIRLRYFGSIVTLSEEGPRFSLTSEDHTLKNLLETACGSGHKFAGILRHDPWPEMTFADYLVREFDMEIIDYDRPEPIDTTDVFPPDEPS